MLPEYLSGCLRIHCPDKPEYAVFDKKNKKAKEVGGKPMKGKKNISIKRLAI